MKEKSLPKNIEKVLQLVENTGWLSLLEKNSHHIWNSNSKQKKTILGGAGLDFPHTSPIFSYLIRQITCATDYRPEQTINSINRGSQISIFFRFIGSTHINVKNIFVQFVFLWSGEKSTFAMAN